MTNFRIVDNRVVTVKLLLLPQIDPRSLSRPILVKEHGWYKIPGGKLFEGETIHEGLLRELSEEGVFTLMFANFDSRLHYVAMKQEDVPNDPLKYITVYFALIIPMSPDNRLYSQLPYNEISPYTQTVIDKLWIGYINPTFRADYSYESRWIDYMSLPQWAIKMDHAPDYSNLALWQEAFITVASGLVLD